VSGLWTPSGGDPVREPPPEAILEEPSAEEIAALREVQARLAATPVEDVIANHAIGILQLALMHLGANAIPDEQGRVPAPNLAAAGLAIDALAALVDGLGARFGENEEPLRQALGQVQMVFVEIADQQGDADAGTS
jgi:hypothetical protein